MSALTDLFSAMANKIRSKTGTATTYTPSEMVSDGIDDVYDAGVASATTPITPSNSSPASMTANTGYKPTTNGYAIASYDSVTPSSTPESVASGDIVKIGGSGVIVDAIPTPTSITPSNSSPVSLMANTAVKPTTSGYAIASYDSVTPSSTQTAVSSGDIIKIGGSGVIVDSVPPTPTSITPSNTNPVALTANTPVKPTANGVAIAAYEDLQPSNSNPPVLVMPFDPSTPPSIYKIVRSSGYAIQSYNNITPSDASPVSLSSGSFYKPSASGYAISSYSSKTPSATNRNYSSLSIGTINKITTRTGYLYGAIPTGRALFSAFLVPDRTTTSWTKVTLGSTAYDVDGSNVGTLIDNNWGSINSNGDIVVSKAISTAYIAGYSPRGCNSSGNAVYCGVALYKNGTVISGASCYGSSSDTSPSFRRVVTSFAVGDVISVYTRVSSTTNGYCRVCINISVD